MNDTNNYFRYEKGTLYVNKRTVRLEERLEIKKDYIREYEYDPVKVHVGAVTTGGFTTGGVYTTGGHYYYGDRASGRYLLAFKSQISSSSKSSKPEFKQEPILNIVLSEEVAAQARNSPVQPYLNGCNIEVNSKLQLSAYYHLLLEKGKYWEAQTEKNRNLSETFPDRRKCETIRNWLCDGEDAKDAGKNAILDSAKIKMKADTIRDLKKAIELLRSIPGWKDADKQALACQQRIKELEAAREVKTAKAKKTAMILAALLAVGVAAYFAVTKVIIPNGKYNDAVALMEAGQYNEAIAAFEELDGYKDSAEQIEACNTAILDEKYNAAVELMEAGEYTKAIVAFKALDGYKDSVEQIEACNAAFLEHDEAESIDRATVGDLVYFGSYEQDNNDSNGKEMIEWLVLDVQDGRALLISEYGLDCKPYNTSYQKVTKEICSLTWETCSLRQWLNNDFIDEAFSAEEQELIPVVTVGGEDSQNATQDQVFLLSVGEAKEYFSSDNARACKPTNYAIAQGAYVNSTSGSGWWWLRTNSFTGAHVNGVGSFSNQGVAAIGDAVRPAIWVNIGE